MRVLVTGVGGPAGRNVGALLAADGHTVTGVDMRQIDLSWLHGFHPVPAADDIAYYNALIELSKDVDLVIPTVQEELPTLSIMHHNLHCKVLIGSQEAVSLAHDKYLTAYVLRLAGVRVPQTLLPSRLALFDTEQIGWPRVVKPRHGRGGRNVTVCDSPATFDLERLNDAYLVQSFMPGVEYSVNLCQPPLGKDDTTVVVLEKLRLREGRTGNAEAVAVVDAPDVAAVAVAAARAIGLYGPMDMDIRRNEKGEPAVLEINARFGANIAHAPEVFAAALEL